MRKPAADACLCCAAVRTGAMRTRPLLAAALAAATLAGIGDAARRQGYLQPNSFDVLQVLPPAPVKGDARYAADRKIFRQTRRMEGTARWEMATADVHYEPEWLGRDFSCAVGVALTPATAPRTFALIQRAGVDTAEQTGIAKNFYKRARPYRIDRGDVCQDKKELGDSYDYPSGHTTWGWTWALVLSDLLPARATAILARGRAYGDSRFICGAHNFSAVEGGKLSATATMEAVRQTPAFQTDAAAARSELRALLLDPAAARPQGCEAERALVAQRVP